MLVTGAQAMIRADDANTENSGLRRVGVDRKTASAFERQSRVYGHDKQEANAFKRARGSECLQVVRNAAGLEY